MHHEQRRDSEPVGADSSVSDAVQVLREWKLMEVVDFGKIRSMPKDALHEIH